MDMDASLKNVYTLPSDGRVLTIASHIMLPMGEMDVTVVSDKQ
jgi:hypothetical protein